MDWQERVAGAQGFVKKKIVKAEQSVDALEVMKEKVPEFECSLVVDADFARLEVSTLDAVKQAKEYLREIGVTNKAWELNLRWGAGGVTLTSWTAPDTDWEIWFRCRVDEYPAELTPEGCGWTHGRIPASGEPTFVCNTIKGADYENTGSQ